MIQREMGAFPISIGTSLAIESALGQYPEKPVSPAPISKYDQLWINVKTLFRNYLGAFAGNAGREQPYNVIVDELFAEMENIKSVIRDRFSNVEVVYFVSDYQIPNLGKSVVLRTDKSPLKQAFTNLYKAVVNEMLYRIRKNELDLILVFKNKIKPKSHVKAMILTHIPYDLLSHYDFAELVLLESHTGTVKPRSEWHTKFNGSQDLQVIPFNESMMRIFGDKEIFEPAQRDLREAVYAMAVEDKWSVATTYDRIVHVIDRMKDRYTATVLKSMLVKN